MNVNNLFHKIPKCFRLKKTKQCYRYMWASYLSYPLCSCSVTLAVGRGDAVLKLVVTSMMSSFTGPLVFSGNWPPAPGSKSIRGGDSVFLSCFTPWVFTEVNSCWVGEARRSDVLFLETISSLTSSFCGDSGDSDRWGSMPRRTVGGVSGDIMPWLKQRSSCLNIYQMNILCVNLYFLMTWMNIILTIVFQGWLNSANLPNKDFNPTFDFENHPPPPSKKFIIFKNEY